MKELSADRIWKAPLILKSDSFWFTRLFMFVVGPCGYYSVVELRVWERLRKAVGF